MTTTAGWDGILEPGETILWQGQPARGVIWADALTPLSLFGLVFAGFALFWMAAAATIISGGPGMGSPFSLFPLFGLPFLVIGVWMMGGHVLWDAYARSTTWYTLTDRTAFIATAALGRKELRSYPIDQMPFLDLEDGAPGSVLFAEPTMSTRRRSGLPVRIGFRRIHDAREVYRRMRALRRGDAPALRSEAER